MKSFFGNCHAGPYLPYIRPCRIRRGIHFIFSCISHAELPPQKRKEGKEERGRERERRKERVTESALIQSFKGPNGGITTTPVISRINWLIITLLYFLAYEEKKRECYQTMSAITVRVAELTAAPIWATSYLLLVEQGRIHGYPSQVWAGRGHI